MENIYRISYEMVRCLLLAVLSLTQIAALYAQKIAAPTCAAYVQHQKLNVSKSQKRLYSDIQKKLKAYIASASALRTDATDDLVYTIPVVVHIIEAYDQPMLTDQQVMDGIANLNKAFRNQLPESDGVDTKIQFKLATRSPDCTPTTGINRLYPNNPGYTTYGVTEKGGPGLSFEQAYGMSFWNNLNYYNIWVVNYIQNAGGQAAFPTGGPSPTDGTMIIANYFNTKALAHELGHGLNLHHTFVKNLEEGDLNSVDCPANDNCAEQGDGICDTEPINFSANYICPGDPNSGNMCNNNQPYGDVLKNYMGYNYNSCQTQFTNDQRTRMRSALELLRPALIRSRGLDPVVTGQTIAKGATGTLNATGCEGIILWYDAQVNGNHLGIGNSFTTPALNESTSFYASCHRLDCPSADRVAGLVTVDPSLPVNLIRFSAALTERNQVALSWATSWEISHDHFDVEQARDAKTFVKRGQVSAPVQVASGISEYQFIDIPEQPADRIYYRLKQIDTDGSYTYSKIVSVRMPETQGITIGPNPTDNSITITGVSKKWDVEVITASGVVVERAKNQLRIDSTRLPAGLYVVRVTMENGHTVAQKIIKK